MIPLSANKIYTSEKTDHYLRSLKGRTGITPNVLCRFAICLSLADRTPIAPYLDLDSSGREFNRYTLTGKWDDVFVALLEVSDNDMESDDLLKAHIDRGVSLMHRQIRTLSDIGDLLPEELQGG